MKTSKLKAFTVLEVLITMGVMSVIISLTYFLYNSFSKQTFVFQKNLTETQQFDTFLTLIKRDFYDCEKVLKTENGFEVIFYGNKNNIVYQTENNYLVRIQNKNKIALEIKNIEIKTLETKPNLISNLFFKAKLFNEFLNIKFTKNYAPNYSIAY